ncbi:tandem-type lipoprotein [Staphylococcus aureus]|nr:tandem-type lipoprotein [Staphylococcus aureus]WRM66254.1 tandem-type lipoprotein [Staphylococcus aureus]WRM76258.1 tandem-type lipoprotein [Staphylococcus aureus]WRM83300.1 tandem-type lipoprotein [Staphylococcus aureus]WRM92947.1 tandem-type lipoprotein [Staphylococcus aureus]
MKRLNKLVLYISFLILVISFTAGCGIGKEAEVKKSFEKTLSMYPIKNLEDLYDKEGYRDDEFDKNDKGTWIIGSEMVVQPKGERMKSKGMVLYMNRNTKTTTGKYIVSETLHDEDGRPKSKDKEYPVKMVDNKIIPTKGIKDENIKKKSRILSSSRNMAALKICRSTKTAIYHIIQRYRVIQQNIN